jgi:hypothetical protein
MVRSMRGAAMAELAVAAVAPEAGGWGGVMATVTPAGQVAVPAVVSIVKSSIV